LNKQKNNAWIIVVVILVIIGIAIGIWYYVKRAKSIGVTIPINTVTYDCAKNKTIEAKYYNDKVDLVLSDGRTMTLPQSESASGVRYTQDESIIFWNKGTDAFLLENNLETFEDCIESSK